MFAIPGGSAGPSELEDILRRILWLTEHARHCPERVTRASNASQELYSRQEYPTRSELKAWLEICNLEHKYDAKTLTAVYTSLLEKTPSALRTHGAEVAETVDVEIAPALPSQKQQLAQLTANAFATVARLQKIPGLLPTLCCGVPSVIGARNFSGKVRELTEDATGTRPSSEDIHASILCVGPDFHWPSHLSPLHIWQSATSPAGIHLALSLAALQIRSESGLKERATKHFIGTGFIESLQRNQAHQSAKYSSATFEACAKIIAGCPKYDLANFNEVRSSDGAEAVRTHITKGGIALRLMCWRRADGIEFANVGPKGELMICHGDSENAFHQWTDFDR
ncbi:hypothetical protein [Vitreimonas sp.]|uniref:hypothetical protein n=1 Tax=Vitreimonas sp. TaxID=3069702 RepID=UPI002EDB4B65